MKRIHRRSDVRRLFWIAGLLLMLAVSTQAQPGAGEIDPDALGAAAVNVLRDPPQAISTGKCAAPLSDTSHLITVADGGFNGEDRSDAPTTDVFFGFNATQNQFLRAEEFYVPRGSIWQPGEITFYAYATGSYAYPPVSSITGIHDLTLWNAPPDSEGATLLASAPASGVITSNAFTGVYRANEVVPLGATRPIFATTIEWPFAAVGALGPGDYWITWTMTAQIGVTPVTVWVPQLSTVSASDNARDRALPNGAWQTSPTGGVPSRAVTLPMTVCGAIVPAPATTALPTAPILWKPAPAFPVIGEQSPLLVWHENHFSDRVLTYQVILKRSVDNVTLFKRFYAPDSVCDVTAVCRVDLAALPFAREAVQLTANGEYTWFVRATNSLGQQKSEVRAFTVDYPGTPGLIAPVGEFISPPTELRWTSIPAATEYKVKIRSGGVTLYNSGWLSGATFACDASTCALNLLAQAGITPALNRTYKWQVQARNAAISPGSSKSAKATFRYVLPTPTPTFTPTPTATPTATPTPSATPTP